MLSFTQQTVPQPGEALEAVGVDLLGRGGHAVPARVRDHQIGAEQGTQPGHARLQGVGGSDGHFRAVQAVDEMSGGHHGAGVEEEQGGQRPHAWPADGHDALAVGPGLHGTENAEPHLEIVAHGADAVSFPCWDRQAPARSCQ
ncbi:MAG: hypothetical protein K0R62_4851 [Nonomuraea muscovyensis]|nr:hypothetical protein [Nonomuraea muscovyensis]